MSSFKIHNQLSVRTATTTGPPVAKPSSSTTVELVLTQMSTGSNDEEAPFSRFTTGPNATTSANRDAPATTDVLGATDNNTTTPKGSKSRTDSTNERVTIESDSDALSSPSTRLMNQRWLAPHIHKFQNRSTDGIASIGPETGWLHHTRQNYGRH